MKLDPSLNVVSAEPSALRLQVEEAADGQRIDNFLIGHFKGVPKTRVYRMLRTGEVRVDGGRVKADFRLQAGQWLRLPPVRVPTPVERDIHQQQVYSRQAADLAQHLQPLYESQGVLAVAKPAGIAVHGGSGVSLGVIEALRQTQPPGFLELVHRLDRDTSGVLLLARQRKTLLALHRQLQQGRMRKQYLACVQGDWSASAQATEPMREPLRKTVAPNGERWVHVHPEGQPSMTKARLLEVCIHPVLGPLSLVLCEPVTGRTHQIRVHLMDRGFPILGDAKYGTEASIAKGAQATGSLSEPRARRRMMLHAWKISLDSPMAPDGQGERITLVAPPDEDFLKRLKEYGFSWSQNA